MATDWNSWMPTMSWGGLSYIEIERREEKATPWYSWVAPSLLRKFPPDTYSLSLCLLMIIFLKIYLRFYLLNLNTI